MVHTYEPQAILNQTNNRRSLVRSLVDQFTGDDEFRHPSPIYRKTGKLTEKKQFEQEMQNE